MAEPQLFLSYAREDAPFCEELVAALRGIGITVLWDRTLSPTLDYADQIREMIRSADAFAVVLSKASAASHECRVEMQYALDIRKRLIPVLLEPDLDAESLPEPVRKIQWCLCTSANELEPCIAQIRRALQTNAELVPMHSMLLNRTEEWQARTRDKTLLLRGTLLKDAESWLDAACDTQELPQPTALQREFLRFSRRRSNLRVRSWSIAGVTLAAVFLVITLVAIFFKGLSDREATEKKAEAERANQNAKIADERSRTLLMEQGRQDLLAGRWDSALVLLKEAYTLGSDTPELRLMLAAAALPLRGIRALLLGNDVPVNCAELSMDGRRLISGGKDGTARVWDLETSRMLAILGPHQGPIDEVYLNQDGTRALVVSTRYRVDADGFDTVVYEPHAQLWDVSNSKRIREWEFEQEFREKNPSPYVRVSTDGGRLIIPDSLEDLEFSFMDGRSLGARPLGASAGRVPHDRSRTDRGGTDSLEPMFHQKPRVLLRSESIAVTTGSDNHLVVWGSPWRTPLVGSVKAREAMIAFRGNSSDLVFLSSDGVLGEIPAGGVADSRKVSLGETAYALSPDGYRSVVLRRGEYLQIAVNEVRPGSHWITEDDLHKLNGARFSRFGRYLLTWWETDRGRDNPYTDFGVTALSNREEIPASANFGPTMIAAVEPVVAVADAGRRFMAESRKLAWIWGYSSPVVLERGAADPVFADFSPDGRYLASALSDGSILVRDMKSLRKENSQPTVQTSALYGHSAAAVHLDFDPESRRLASASNDGTARIWQLESFTLLSTCRGHNGAIQSVRFSRDGTLLVTAGADGTARVWESASCTELLRFPGHTGKVIAAVFDASGSRLATADPATVRVWDLPREMRSAAELERDVSHLTPACLIGGRLGRWSTPKVGASPVCVSPSASVAPR